MSLLFWNEIIIMNNYQFSFEKLEVWQNARALAKEVYTTTQAFPTDEKFALVQQIRKSALSICANLAEGTTRITHKDQAHFTIISFSSKMELLNHMIIAFDLAYFNEERLNYLRSLIQPLSVKLSNLKKAQLSRLRGFKSFLLILFSYPIYQPLQPLTQ